MKLDINKKSTIMIDEIMDINGCWCNTSGINPSFLDVKKQLYYKDIKDLQPQKVRIQKLDSYSQEDNSNYEYLLIIFENLNFEELICRVSWGNYKYCEK